jgi:hypothetical protein
MNPPGRSSEAFFMKVPSDAIAEHERKGVSSALHRIFTPVIVMLDATVTREAPMPATAMHPPAAHPGTTLGKALGPIHERWRADVHAALAPALHGGATRWDRWTVVRYLRDRFVTRVEQERTLVRMIPGMKPAALARIEAAYAALERLRAQIDVAGRQRHTGGLVMGLSADFLELLADWCARVEHATAAVPLATLPAEAARILDELEAPAPA